MLKDVNVLVQAIRLPLVSCINYYRMKEIYNWIEFAHLRRLKSLEFNMKLISLSLWQDLG